ncbi:transglutaminase-like domain-containing protein [Nubsella zeaxanthinifaciens]|uniref:transglutaminase-like domain-containing protein n=1 Tax=Nubsella zeaxanthinifaciens TaxID=392412 RepID=UPI003CFCE3BB
MPFKQTLLTLLLLLCSCFVLKSQEIDTTVNITSYSSSYTFVKEKGTDKVQVKESHKIKYKCTRPTVLPLAAYYNENSKVTLFECKINGSRFYYKPKDTYVAIKDIFYSDARVVYYDLEIPANAVVELTVEKTTLNPIYFTNIQFVDDYKTQAREIAIDIPAWMDVTFKELNFDGFKIEKNAELNAKDGMEKIVYKAVNLPAIKKERYSPGNTFIYPHLFALASKKANQDVKAYFTSLQEQYNWYHSLTANLDEHEHNAITAQVSEICKGKTTDLDKVKAVFYWIQQHIRYIAFEDGIAGFRPDKASEVLRKKYGDCKGMANLTKTMLKALNLDARLCWIGTNHLAYNYETPSLAVDNHMIAAVKLNDRFHFLDATETYLGFNEYAERIQGRQVLIEDGEKYILTNVPTTKVQQNLDFQLKTLSIDGKNLIGTAEQVWEGEEKENMLSSLHASKKDEMLESMSSFINSGNNNFEVKDLTHSDLNSFDGQVSAKFSVLLKNSIDVFGKEQYVNLDATKEFANFFIDTAKRSHDYWLPYKMNVRKEIVLKIPAGFAVANKPNNLVINTPDYAINLSYEVNKDVLTYKKSIQIHNTKINKKNFGTWNNDFKKLSQYYQEPITLKSTL